MSQPSTPIAAMHPTFSKPGNNTQTSTANPTQPPGASSSSMDPMADFLVGDVSVPQPVQPNLKTNAMQNNPNNYMNLEFADPNTTNDVLENFDFDSFLHTTDDGGMSLDFYDGGTIEAGNGI
jgi:hypothetical protein